jgi:hypothetical protein
MPNKNFETFIKTLDTSLDFDILLAHFNSNRNHPLEHIIMMRNEIGKRSQKTLTKIFRKAFREFLIQAGYSPIFVKSAVKSI